MTRFKMTGVFERLVFVPVVLTSIKTVAAWPGDEIAITAGAVLSLLAITSCCVCFIFLLQECSRRCSKKLFGTGPTPTSTNPGPAHGEINVGRINKSEPDPFYDEINEGQELTSLPPPHLPKRYPAKHLAKPNVPVEYAPARPEKPEEPEYLIPEAPDDLLDPDGYVKPNGFRS